MKIEVEGVIARILYAWGIIFIVFSGNRTDMASITLFVLGVIMLTIGSYFFGGSEKWREVVE